MIATLIKRTTAANRALVVTHCPAEASSEAPSVALLSVFAEGRQVAGTFLSAADCYAMGNALLQAASLIDADEAQREQRRAADAAKPVDTTNAQFAFDFDDKLERYTLPALRRLYAHRPENRDLLAWATQARPGQRHEGTLLRRVA